MNPGLSILALLAGAPLSGCTGVVAGAAQDGGKDAALDATSTDGAADGGGPVDALDPEPVDAETLEAGMPDAELTDAGRRDVELADAAPGRDGSASPDAGPRSDGGAPAWLASMTAPNTLYGVGEIPSDVLPGRIQGPGAGANNRLESGGSDNNPLYLTSGYGGSVFVPELGPWGTMIFGGTGEHSVTEQLLSFGVSEDSPSWRFRRPQRLPCLEMRQIPPGHRHLLPGLGIYRDPRPAVIQTKRPKPPNLDPPAL